MAEEKPAQEKTSPRVRLRRAALFVLFSLVLLIPKTLALRRRSRLWNSLRLAAATLGLALLVRGGGEWNGASIVGGLLVVAAVLTQPAKEEKSVDGQARELGALVVLNGGEFQVAGGKPTAVRLFVASERVHVLDSRHRPLLEIPLAAVSSIRVEESKGAKEGWRLVIEWPGGTATFFYEGFFAEHLARIAETTLNSQLRRELPVVK